ncbi:MAG: VOC family protein [Bacillota bacterium]
MKWEDSIVFLGVEDLEKVDSFYRKVLQFSLYRDQGLCRIYEIPGGGKIGFCSHMDKNISHRAPIITLLTEQVDEVYRKVKKKEINILHPPEVNEKFNIYHFFMEDPEGYSVEIQKFLD